jgi:hypothetical protein
MGGKGRGVFSDFRMGRVWDDMFFEKYGADHLTVPIPSKRPRWKPTGCEESKLVDLPC